MGKQRRLNKNEIREKIEQMYFDKYYSLFLGHYHCDSLTEEQRRFVLSQMWLKGAVACWILPESKTTVSLNDLKTNKKVLKQDDENLMIFTPFAPNTFNLNNGVSVATLVALRGAQFITNKELINNKDIVIGYGHTSHKAVVDLIKPLIERIVEIEMTINTCLFNNKLPRLIVCSPEDKAKLKDLVSRVENDENVIYLDSDSADVMKDVLTSGEYVIDRLYTYKTQIENEILTLLGIDNIQNEKKERMLTNEVDANNDIISYNAHLYLDTLNEWGDRVDKILGEQMIWYIDPVEEEICDENIPEEEISEEGDEENE